MKTITIYKIGDFWEMFSDDAERAAKILGQTVTTRTSDGLKMVGFPISRERQYVEMLVAAGEVVKVGQRGMIP